MSLSDFFGSLFGAQPDVPLTKITAAESKVSAYDPLAPRTLCLGRSAWSTSLGWSRTHEFSDGTPNPKESLTQVLCAGSHPMGPLQEILLAEKIYTVGNSDGSGGDDFIPASLTSGNWDNTIEAADWYVPNRAKDNMRRWWRTDGGQDRFVVAFKWFDGTQTTHLRNDDWMVHIDTWSDVDRDFRNEACLAITWRVGINEETFSGSPPRLMPICHGAQNVHRWGSGTVSYSDRALDCFTHWLMWEYGPFQEVDNDWVKQLLKPSGWDADIMDEESDICGENVDGEARYEVAYQIHSGQDPQEVYDTFSYLCGGLRVWKRANGLWAARVGHDRAPVASFDLGAGDGIDNITTRRHRQHSDLYNHVTTSYISDTNLFEMVEATKSDPSYRNADGGVRLYENLTCRGRHGRANIQRLNLIHLDRHRLEEGISFSCWHRFGRITGVGRGAATCVEAGDIVLIDYPRRGWLEKEFELVNKTFDFASMTYLLEFDEWGGIRWEGEGDTPEEVGDDAGRWDGRLSTPTGLTVVSAGQPVTTLPSGAHQIAVLVDVDDHPEEALVAFLGGYSFRWRRSTDSKWRTVNTDESRAVIADLRVGLTYEFQARVYTMKGRGTTKSEWTDTLSALIGSDYGTSLPAPTSDTSQAGNLVADWDFNRSAVLSPNIENPYWDAFRISGQDGTVTFSATGGKLSPPSLVIYSGTDAPSQPDQAVTEEVPHPAVPGELYKVGAWVLNVDGTATAPRYALRLQARNLDSEIIVDAETDIGAVYTNTFVWSRNEQVVQVHRAAGAPLLGGLEAHLSDTGTGPLLEFPTVAPLSTGRLGLAFAAHNAAVTVQTSPTGEVGSSWIFRGRDVSSSGDGIGILAYEADLRAAQVISGGSVSQDAGDRWVIIAGAVGNDADPTAGVTFQQKGTANAQTSDTNNLTPSYPVTGLQAGDVFFAVVAVHADSGRSIASPGSPWFSLRTRSSGDMTITVFGRVADGTESSTQAFDWAGTSVGVGVDYSDDYSDDYSKVAVPTTPAALAVIYRYRGALGLAAYAEIQLRARYDDTNAQTSTFRFDGILMERTDRFGMEVFADDNNNTNTSYVTIVSSRWFFAPPQGKAVRLQVSASYFVDVLSPGTGSSERLRLVVGWERESDFAETVLKNDKGVAVFKSADTGDELEGSWGVNLRVALTPEDGSFENDRFRFFLKARVSHATLRYDLTDMTMQISFQE